MKIRSFCLTLLAGIFLVSCKEKVFKLENAANPWEDDYAYLVNDSLYWEKSGNYNIQDPSVTRFKNDYYLFSADVLYGRLPERVQEPADTAAMKRGIAGMSGGRTGEGYSGKYAMRGGRTGEGYSGKYGMSGSRSGEGYSGKYGMSGSRSGEGYTGKYGMSGSRSGDRAAYMKNRPPMDRAKLDSIIKSRGWGKGLPKGNLPNFKNPATERGLIQIRKSSDMTNWNFVGWVFDSIPDQAAEHLKKAGCNPAMAYVSAPEIVDFGGIYRLYYCLDIPYRRYMYMGMAEAEDPAGEWKDAGCMMEFSGGEYYRNMKPVVVRHGKRFTMALSVENRGIRLMDLDAETGHIKKSGNRYIKCGESGFNLSDLVFNRSTGKFYLFGSVPGSPVNGSLSVWRSSKIEGPYSDSRGIPLSRILPREVKPLMASYKVYMHVGWIFNGKYDVLEDEGDRWFAVTQGRPSNNPRQMVLNSREMFFMDSWPLISPERYVALPGVDFEEKDLCGDYEVLCWDAQNNDFLLQTEDQGRMFCSKFISLAVEDGDWNFDRKLQRLDMTLWDGTRAESLIVLPGHDWDDETNTVVFMGRDEKGNVVLGKRIRSELDLDLD